MLVAGGGGGGPLASIKCLRSKLWPGRIINCSSTAPQHTGRPGIELTAQHPASNYTDEALWTINVTHWSLFEQKYVVSLFWI